MAGKPKSKVEAGKQKPEKKTKSNAGAKSKYNDFFPLLAEGYARDGLTDAEIAAKLDISKDAFYRYQKQYPAFYDALKRGKAPVDTEIENCLLKRARGYTYTERTVETCKDDKGRDVEKKKLVEKHVMPDVTAQIFWLKNRRRHIYRENGDKGFTKPDEMPVLTVEEIPNEDGSGDAE